MSATPVPVDSKSLVGRIKAILLQPDATWRVIDGESATVAGLYSGYIALLAAIPPIANFIRFAAFFHWPVAWGIERAVAHYILTLIGVYVAALVIDALAPSFGGTRSKIQALKLVAYASTAGWLASIFNLIPGLAILSIIGLYSVYLFWVGLPILMKSPPERSLGYTIVAAVCVAIVYVVIGAITAAVVGVGGYGYGYGTAMHY
jgi:hypothetical protein